MDFPYLDCSRVQSDFSFFLWNFYRKFHFIENSFFIENSLFSSCRIQSDKNLPFKDLNLPNKKNFNYKHKNYCKKNDQMFAVKKLNHANTRNKRKKINKSSISASVLIKLNEFFCI